MGDGKKYWGDLEDHVRELSKRSREISAAELVALNEKRAKLGWIPLTPTDRQFVEAKEQAVAKNEGIDRPADVFNPQHYRATKGGIETVDAMEAFFSDDMHLSQAFKYMARAGKKPTSSYTEDVKKAMWWLERALEYAGRGTPE